MILQEGQLRLDVAGKEVMGKKGTLAWKSDAHTHIFHSNMRSCSH